MLGEIAEPEERILAYYDPLGEKNGKMKSILDYWSAYMYMPKALQTDGYCGVFILKFAESHIGKKRIQTTCFNQLRTVRKKLANLVWNHMYCPKSHDGTCCVCASGSQLQDAMIHIWDRLVVSSATGNAATRMKGKLQSIYAEWTIHPIYPKLQTKDCKTS